MAKAEKKRPKHEKKPEPAQQGITKLIVNNFKSLARPEPYEIEIRPLTILAGANSSGKSSAVQPLLLLKQTLEASFDPGPLWLNGPHVKISSLGQISPRTPRSLTSQSFVAGVKSYHAFEVRSFFSEGHNNSVSLDKTEVTGPDMLHTELMAGLSQDQMREASGPMIQFLLRDIKDLYAGVEAHFRVIRRRCFLELIVSFDKGLGPAWPNPVTISSPVGIIESTILEVLHVPGLRGNPKRSYEKTAVGSTFPGTFETYTASIIHDWHQRGSAELQQLCEDLQRLDLSWTVSAKIIDAANVELQVGRLQRARKGGSADLVNIADVGLGVSQVLPVLVALLVAEPGQLVYIEQPEIHLHPKAQVALAEILAAAAKRGVRVIIETHSSLLLLAIQALVAEGKLDSKLAILHWFRRSKTGISEISSAELDDKGAYGDWPEDFGETELAIQSRYLDAAEERILRAARG